MWLVLTAERAELLHFQPLSCGLLVFSFAVVTVFALTALELNNFSWHEFLTSRRAATLFGATARLL